MNALEIANLDVDPPHSAIWATLEDHLPEKSSKFGDAKQPVIIHASLQTFPCHFRPDPPMMVPVDDEVLSVVEWAGEGVGGCCI